MGGGEGILVWIVKSAWIRTILAIEQLSACAYLQCALQHTLSHLQNPHHQRTMDLICTYMSPNIQGHP